MIAGLQERGDQDTGLGTTNPQLPDAFAQIAVSPARQGIHGVTLNAPDSQRPGVRFMARVAHVLVTLFRLDARDAQQFARYITH